MPTAFSRAGWFLLPAILIASSGLAADHLIAGRRIVVRNPSGDEARRSVTVLGRETATDIPPIAGDPTFNGGTIELVADGASPTSQFIFLPHNGWSATASGFRFDGPVLGEPVKKVVIKRTPAGTALVKMVLDGALGTQPLDVVPPAPGAEVGLILTVGLFGERYCVTFGGASGGVSTVNTSQRWRIQRPTAQPGCPTFPPRCCSFGDACAWIHPSQCFFSLEGIVGGSGTACDSQTGACVPPPASAGDCCMAGFTIAPCFGNIGADTCDRGDGIYVANAVCTPEGTCASPSGAFVDR